MWDAGSTTTTVVRTIATWRRKIIEICRDRRPDALLIAGDLFDNDRPSAADERLVADTLARLHAEVPEMTVIAIAGNHDSPSRHESHEAVYAAAGVVMIGRITDRDPDWPGRYIIDVGAGVVVAVPFYIAKGTDLARLMAEADKIADGRPVVAMGIRPCVAATPQATTRASLARSKRWRPRSFCHRRAMIIWHWDISTAASAWEQWGGYATAAHLSR